MGYEFLRQGARGGRVGLGVSVGGFSETFEQYSPHIAHLSFLNTGTVPLGQGTIYALDAFFSSTAWTQDGGVIYINTPEIGYIPVGGTKIINIVGQGGNGIIMAGSVGLHYVKIQVRIVPMLEDIVPETVIDEITLTALSVPALTPGITWD